MEIDLENPRTLFKYRAFDHRAMQSLIDNKIWLAIPESFNDPFDCRFYIDRLHSDEELLNHLNFCAENRGDTKRYTLEDIPQERPHFENILTELENGVQNAGAFCLSATPFEPLMWAHYADGHRGFCIEYERRQDNDLRAGSCLRVSYDEPILPTFRGLDFFSNGKEILMNIFKYKSKSWSYEKEWRFLRMWKTSPDTEVRSYRLNARILSISFGLRMPRRDALTVIRVLRYCTGIEFYQMSAVPEQLALTAVPFEFSEEELDI
ncbi:MAG: DUF2971 domain-containing protein [Sideroxydans sp.]|nr:DUF2971 domain-containing protein [Sideroxydans sp.]